MRFGAVLDDHQAMAFGDLHQSVHVDRMTVKVHRDNRPRSGSDAVLDEDRDPGSRWSFQSRSGLALRRCGPRRAPSRCSCSRLSGLRHQGRFLQPERRVAAPSYRSTPPRPAEHPTKRATQSRTPQRRPERARNLASSEGCGDRLDIGSCRSQARRRGSADHLHFDLVLRIAQEWPLLHADCLHVLDDTNGVDAVDQDDRVAWS